MAPAARPEDRPAPGAGPAGPGPAPGPTPSTGAEPSAGRAPGGVGLRALGLAGTGLLTAGGYAAGALPGSADASGARSTGGLYWLGLAACAIGLGLLATAWWRLDPTGRDRPARPVRWLLVTGAMWALPLLVAPPLASRDVYAYACQGSLWLSGINPYTAGASAGCPWVTAVPALWRDTPTPYGPLAVALSGLVVAVARAVAGTADSQLVVAVGLLRLVALAGGVLIAGGLPRLARAGGVDPAAATWLGLLSPLVAVHLVAGAHNDGLMVGLVVAALALAVRPAARPGRRDRALAVAGIMLGLAVAVKVTAIVALPYAILLGMVRSGTDGRVAPPRLGPVVAVSRALPRLGRAAAPVLVGAALAFAGLSLATGLDLGWVGALSDTGRLVQWTSLPTGLGMTAGYLLRVAGRPADVDLAVAVARLLGLIVLAVLAAGLLLRAWRAASSPVAAGRSDTADRVAGASAAGLAEARRWIVVSCGATVAALAVLSPVFYPWYALAALAVLAAGIRDRRWIRRLAGAAVVLSLLVLPDGLGLAVLTKLPGALLDTVIVIALAVAVVRSRRSGRHVAPISPTGR